MIGPGRKLIAWLLLGAAALAVGYTIWPTPWRYFPLQGSSSAAATVRFIPLIRVSRLTGRAERLTSTGWMKLAPVEVNPFADLADTAPQRSVRNPIDTFLDSLRLADSVRRADSADRRNTGRLRPFR